MLFLAMTICAELREVKSSQAPLGILSGVTGSPRGCPELTASGLANPSGTAVSTSMHSRGSYHHPGPMVSSSSEASSGQLRVSGAVSLSWDSGPSPSTMAPSIRVGKATGSSSTTSSMDASNRSSLSVKGMRHLWRSLTALQSMPG